MSNDNGAIRIAPVLPEPVGEEVEWECERCHNKFKYAPPLAEIANNRACCTASWAHPKLVTCPNCQLQFLFVIRNIHTAWALVPVEERGQDRQRIIVPPSGMRLPQ